MTGHCRQYEILSHLTQLLLNGLASGTGTGHLIGKTWLLHQSGAVLLASEEMVAKPSLALSPTAPRACSMDRSTT